MIDNAGAIHVGAHAVFRATHLPIELVSFPGAVLTIGDRCFINTGTSISASCSVTIGDDVKIGMQCLIMDTDFHDVSNPYDCPAGRPVRIENGAWLAGRVTVLKGVTIGERAVVAAGAVVTRDVPANTLVAGVPARTIRTIGADRSLTNGETATPVDPQ
jgi:acetyltransferase-like isoleucine patch superfamily enzyme